MAAGPTNIGSLTTAFAPTVTSCSTWFLAQSSRDTWVQYGTVGPAASACFPSGCEPISGYYSPGVLPPRLSARMHRRHIGNRHHCYMLPQVCHKNDVTRQSYSSLRAAQSFVNTVHLLATVVSAARPPEERTTPTHATRSSPPTVRCPLLCGRRCGAEEPLRL